MVDTSRFGFARVLRYFEMRPVMAFGLGGLARLQNKTGGIFFEKTEKTPGVHNSYGALQCAVKFRVLQVTF